MKDKRINRLSHKTRKEVRRIYSILKEVHTVTYEQFLDAFLSDRHPEREISIWSNIADAFLLFTDGNSSPQERDAIYGIIFQTRCLPRTYVEKNLKGSGLDEERASEILNYMYKKYGEPATVVIEVGG